MGGGGVKKPGFFELFFFFSLIFFPFKFTCNGSVFMSWGGGQPWRAKLGLLEIPPPIGIFSRPGCPKGVGGGEISVQGGIVKWSPIHRKKNEISRF